MRESIFSGAVILCLTTVAAGAQTAGRGSQLAPIPVDAPTRQAPDASAPSRLKIDLSRLNLDDRARTDRWSPRLDAQDSTRSSKRSATRKILGGIVGATAGFFAGGYTGAWIEGDRCHCDDPGLQGALIGAPIGAVVGGVLGALFLF
jgi:hypothetical protein